MIKRKIDVNIDSKNNKVCAIMTISIFGRKIYERDVSYLFKIVDQGVNVDGTKIKKGTPIVFRYECYADKSKKDFI